MKCHYPGRLAAPGPSHSGVLDGHWHLTKLDASFVAKAKSQLQSYEAALAERNRKAALLSDGKKMENGYPCANFVFADDEGTLFCKNVDSDTATHSEAP
jgi:hypothetical protein